MLELGERVDERAAQGGHDERGVARREAADEGEDGLAHAIVFVLEPREEEQQVRLGGEERVELRPQRVAELEADGRVGVRDEHHEQALEQLGDEDEAGPRAGDGATRRDGS